MTDEPIPIFAEPVDAGEILKEAPAEDPLQTPVQFIPGVGPARAKLLAKLELKTAEDLLFYAPRDVLDLSDVRGPSELEAGFTQSVRGTVVDTDSRPLRNNKSLTAVLIRCGADFVRGVWFNQPWMLKKFRLNDVVLFSGKPKRQAGRWEFSSPMVQWLEIDDDDTASAITVLPRYGLTDGLKMHEIRRIIGHAVETCVDFVADKLPQRLLEECQIIGIRDAIRNLHKPPSILDYNNARRRLIFEDLVEFQLAVAIRRRAWKVHDGASVHKTTPKIDSRIRRLFPFQMTKGQDKAIKDITADLASGKAMHRLLQADVGAGKTAIAMYAMLVAIANDHQAVLMAPTELLARQHWTTIDKALAHSRVTRTLLTGQLTAAQRRDRVAQIGSGEMQLIVGTQSLIQKDIQFGKLGLAVIDEQHKFGVGQRAQFSVGDQHPHVLVMTATPIPRSLCLTQFGDLDLTLINELPPGRQPVKTWRVHDRPTQGKAWKFIRDQLAQGRQAFVVCPRVGDSNLPDSLIGFDDPFPASDDVDDEGLAGNTEELYRQLKDGELKDIPIGIVHGRMDTQQKADAMDAFRTGETRALVSTTVIEVGVDVPNASIMVIQEAERFGLSQLHQLRGRVGRGSHQAYCFLFSDGTSPDVVKRLSAMEQHTDGFQIAEVDFEIRGPGDVLGTRQHGALPLRFADLLRDRKVLEEARESAFRLVDNGDFDSPEFAPLKVSVLDRFGDLMNLPRSG
jgi:ATP-dependent DNA helicase RecG